MDKGEHEGLRDRFFKERRLLLGVSAILLAHQFLQISISNTEETLGLQFTIANPSRVWVAVWIVWGWTILCYVQQFNSLQPWRDYPSNRDERARERMSKWITRWRVWVFASIFALRNVPTAKMLKTMPAELTEVSSVMGKTMLLSVTMLVVWRETEKQSLEKMSENLDRAMQRKKWRGSGAGLARDGTQCSLSRSLLFPLKPLRDGRSLRLISRVWILVSTSFVTDYIAPLAVGIVPLWMPLMRLWH